MKHPDVSDCYIFFNAINIYLRVPSYPNVYFFWLKKLEYPYRTDTFAQRLNWDVEPEISSSSHYNALKEWSYQHLGDNPFSNNNILLKNFLKKVGGVFLFP